MEGVILFADDHIYTSKRAENALFESLRIDLPVLGVHNLELASQAIKSIGSFTALILDWQYSDDDTFEDIASELGQSKINMGTAQREDAAYKFLLANDFYSLIYIFSEKDIEEIYGETLREKFGNRIRIRKKDESFTEANIQTFKRAIIDDINNWRVNNQNLSIPIQWSSAINESIQLIFKELSEANLNWLKEIYDSASSDGVNPELFVIELLQLLLSEAVIQNKDLVASIIKIGLNQAEAIKTEDLERHRKSISKLFSRLFYSKLKPDSPIMTGDIFCFQDSEFGVLISPECDIKYICGEEKAEFEFLTFHQDSFNVHLKKNNSFDKVQTKYESLKDARKVDLRKLFNQEQSRFHVLPSLPFLNADCNQTCIIDFRSGTKRVKSSEATQLKRIYKVNSPFIQQLRQRYLSHIGRIGTAALPNHVRDWNLM